jgi:hypothetical protein
MSAHKKCFVQNFCLWSISIQNLTWLCVTSHYLRALQNENYIHISNDHHIVSIHREEEEEEEEEEVASMKEK